MSDLKEKMEDKIQLSEEDIKDVKPIPNSENDTQPDVKNIHYEGNIAIYTDPESKYQYEWSQEKNEWVTRTKVTYSFENDRHTYTDAEGVKFFWDKDKNAWFPEIDDEFMAHYQMNYGFTDSSVHASNKNTVADEKQKEIETKQAPKPEKRKATQPEWFELDESKNTKVYVSNLPTDITEEEFIDLMQKCGLVMRDDATGNFKIKLYREPNSNELKGDALCTYIRIESVDLALNLLDGYVFKNKKIKVERAKFQMKGHFDPKLKPKMKKRKEKAKLKKKQEKLFDWRPEKAFGEKSKHERIVIIKNLFHPDIFDKDVGLILEFQQDLREECSKIGEVKKVTIFDRHPEGVAQINMGNPEEAEEVVKLLNGRYFMQRLLSAEIWDGKTKYKIAETDAEINQRIKGWDEFLEQDNKSNIIPDQINKQNTN